MCGIAGILNKDKPVDQSIIENMGRVIAHRGPDDSGNYVEGTIGLAHRRLSIIDVATGHQPMWDHDHRYVIVFNGEIYNYLELRQELVSAGYPLKTTSDTEVLLYAFIRDGAACLKKLIGMFAFAVHDTKTGKTFLARDHFGVKPLYYAMTDEGLIFASEIKALLQHPKFKARPNQGALYEYLTFQFCLDDRTLFEGVRKVEPAQYIVVQKGQIIERAYFWRVNFEVDTHHTEEYFLDRLSFLLQDSIRLQLRSDVPLGAYLSGGLDSSAVVCYATKFLGKPISTFTGGFREDPRYDETAYAKAVAEATGAQYHEIFPGCQDFIDQIGNLIYHMDEPAAGPGLFPQYFVSKLASKNVKVVLGGQGGDEIFGGYARYMVGYLEQCIKAAIFEKQEEGRFLVKLDTIVPNLPLLKEYVPLLKKFWSKGLFEDMDRRYFSLINRLTDLPGLYSEDFLSEYAPEKAFETFQCMFNAPETKSYFNKMTYFDMRTLLPALLQVEDRMSMAVSLESRVPLLDHRIVELVASMPPTMKFANGQTKHVFKQVVGPLLPEKILKRKDKMGFPVPLSEWLKKGPGRDFVLGVLTSKKAKERGILSQVRVEEMLTKALPFERQVWGALCLELWFERFMDANVN